MQRKLDIPQEKSLPGWRVKLPHVFVADEAFPITPNIMRPHSRRKKPLTNSKRWFNTHLSTAWHMVESAFGILSARFRFLKCTMELFPENYCKLLQAAICLHNFLTKGVRSQANMCVLTKRLNLEDEKMILENIDLPGNSVVYTQWKKYGMRPNQAALQTRNMFANTSAKLVLYLGKTGDWFKTNETLLSWLQNLTRT